jgi:hypothetical protein
VIDLLPITTVHPKGLRDELERFRSELIELLISQQIEIAALRQALTESTPATMGRLEELQIAADHGHLIRSRIQDSIKRLQIEEIG